MEDGFSLPEPENYFVGVYNNAPLLADNILLFSRNSVSALNQNAQAITPHRRYVLCLCLETAGSVFIGHKRIDLEPNQALLIPPFRFHYYDSHQKTGHQWVFLTFDTKSQSPLLSINSVAISFASNLREHISKLCRLYLELDSSKQQRFLLESNTFLYELLHQAKSDGKQEAPEAASNSPSLAQRLQRLLEQAPDIPISQIAKELGFSEGHLRHEFRRKQNMSVSHYVDNFRLHYAIDLLHDRKSNLPDISHKLGYSSQASFTRFFKRMTKITPAKFRRETLGQ